jgi:hypothetical protein
MTTRDQVAFIVSPNILPMYLSVRNSRSTWVKTHPAGGSLNTAGHKPTWVVVSQKLVLQISRNISHLPHLSHRNNKCYSVSYNNRLSARLMPAHLVFLLCSRLPLDVVVPYRLEKHPLELEF